MVLVGLKGGVPTSSGNAESGDETLLRSLGTGLASRSLDLRADLAISWLTVASRREYHG